MNEPDRATTQENQGSQCAESVGHESGAEIYGSAEMVSVVFEKMPITLLIQRGWNINTTSPKRDEIQSFAGGA